MYSNDYTTNVWKVIHFLFNFFWTENSGVILEREFDRWQACSYFKYLWSIGSPESLIVKVYKWFFVSENMTIGFDAD